MRALQREAVAQIARGWVGTAYHHQGRIKGVGVDCAYLAVEVYAEAGMLPRLDLGDYPQSWMLHRSEERYLSAVQEHAKEIQAPEVGDLVVMRFGRTFSHGAIFVGDGCIVHAFVGRGVVVSELAEFADRPKRYFTLFGVSRA